MIESIYQEIEDLEIDFGEAYEIAEKYPNLIDLNKFNLDNYKKAYEFVHTRAFGWSLPMMMLVPFADNCNHFNVENYFDLFNKRLAKAAL